MAYDNHNQSGIVNSSIPSDGPLTVSDKIVENIREGICVQDIHGRIEWMNPACETMLGYSLAELKGRFAQDFILPPGRRQMGVDASTFTYDFDRAIFDQDIVREFQHRDGSRFWVQQSFTILQMGSDATCRKVVITCRDVSNQITLHDKLRQVNDNLKNSAYHDTLTGLANRVKLDQFMASPEVAGAIAKGRLGLVQIDLEKFKHINDSYGHAVGDAALRRVAAILRANSGDDDLVCRTGGNEFLLICLKCRTPKALLERAKSLQSAIRAPTDLNDRIVTIETSVGVSMTTAPTDTGEDLVQRADKALFNAKASNGTSIALYTDEIGQRYHAQMTQIMELKTALSEDQFEIYLQPQMRLASGDITGCEALIRWNHPERGLLAPGQFLPNVERAGLGAELDYKVMNMSLDALVELRRNDFHDLCMSINVSSAILADVNYPGLLDWALQSRNIAPASICVEILENTILDDESLETATAMERLRRIGVRIALDDFGTGYAGLAHMSSFDVDAIKLDRSMILRLGNDHRNRMIVRSIIRLCDQLDISVVAEGVETKEQFDVLRRANCPVIQGFGLARPMPVADMVSWLKSGATPSYRMFSNTPEKAETVPLTRQRP